MPRPRPPAKPWTWPDRLGVAAVMLLALWWHYVTRRHRRPPWS